MESARKSRVKPIGGVMDARPDEIQLLLRSCYLMCGQPETATCRKRRRMNDAEHNILMLNDPDAKATHVVN